MLCHGKQHQLPRAFIWLLPCFLLALIVSFLSYELHSLPTALSGPSPFLPPTSPGRNAYLRAGEHTYLPSSKSLTPTTFGGPRYRECTACQQSVLQLDDRLADGVASMQ